MDSSDSDSVSDNDTVEMTQHPLDYDDDSDQNSEDYSQPFEDAQDPAADDDDEWSDGEAADKKQVLSSASSKPWPEYERLGFDPWAYSNEPLPPMSEARLAAERELQEADEQRTREMTRQVDEAANRVLRASLYPEHAVALDIAGPDPGAPVVSVRGLVFDPSLPQLIGGDASDLVRGKRLQVRVTGAWTETPIQLYNSDETGFAAVDEASGVDPLDLAVDAVPLDFMCPGIFAEHVDLRRTDVEIVTDATHEHISVWRAARQDPNSRVWRALYIRLARQLVARQRPVTPALVARDWRHQLQALINMHGYSALDAGGRVAWAAWDTHLAGPRGCTLVVDTRSQPYNVYARFPVHNSSAISIVVRLHGAAPGTSAVHEMEVAADGRAVSTRVTADTGDQDLAPNAIKVDVGDGGDGVTMVRVGVAIRALLGETPRHEVTGLLLSQNDRLLPNAAAVVQVLCHTLYGSGPSDRTRQLFAATKAQSLVEISHAAAGSYDATDGLERLFPSLGDECARIDPRRAIVFRVRVKITVFSGDAPPTAQITHVGVYDTMRNTSLFVASRDVRLGPHLVVTGHILPSENLGSYAAVRSDGLTNGPLLRDIPVRTGAPPDLHYQQMAPRRARLPGELEYALVRATHDQEPPPLSPGAWIAQLPPTSNETLLLIDEDDPEYADLNPGDIHTSFTNVARPTPAVSSVGPPNNALFGQSDFYNASSGPADVHLGVLVSGLHPRPDITATTANVQLAVRDSTGRLRAAGIDLVRTLIYVDTDATSYFRDAQATPAIYSNSAPIARTFALHAGTNYTFALPYSADLLSEDSPLPALSPHHHHGV